MQIDLIYNGFSQWLRSDAVTCWNPKEGESTVNNLTGSPSLIPEITELLYLVDLLSGQKIMHIYALM